MADSKGKKPSAVLSMLAGGFAGGVEATLTYPTEYVKTQMQLQGKQGAGAKFKGPIDCVVKTVRERGIAGLYKGLSAMVIGNSAKAGVRFVAYEQFQRLVAGPDGKASSGGMMLAGLGAGMTEAALVVTPTETIKTKLIHDQNSPSPRFRGLTHATATIFREEGIAGIWRGVGPVMARQGANQAVRFSAYGTIKDWISKRYPVDAKGRPVTPWYVSFGSGVVAGIITVYATMPVDVVKTKMQSLDGKQKYGNSLRCVAMVAKEEGILAFWKGATPRLGRLMFSGAIVFTTYEQIMKVFESLNWT
ncbi:mitochondrial carrier domain-containing protein [Hyaloraphidium curvatum]|nr:mitochondrial carrier domain-containing protein [Hyaloraphidium curvatum]